MTTQMLEVMIPTPDTARARALAFIFAFEAAPNGADVAMRGGSSQTEGAPPAIVIIEIQDSVYVFTADEARAIADMCERAMYRHPDDPRCRGIADLIMGLRESARRAESRQDA